MHPGATHLQGGSTGTHKPPLSLPRRPVLGLSHRLEQPMVASPHWLSPLPSPEAWVYPGMSTSCQGLEPGPLWGSPRPAHPHTPDCALCAAADAGEVCPPATGPLPPSVGTLCPTWSLRWVLQAHGGSGWHRGQMRQGRGRLPRRVESRILCRPFTSATGDTEEGGQPGNLVGSAFPTSWREAGGVAQARSSQLESPSKGLRACVS